MKNVLHIYWINHQKFVRCLNSSILYQEFNPYFSISTNHFFSFSSFFLLRLATWYRQPNERQTFVSGSLASSSIRTNNECTRLKEKKKVGARLARKQIKESFLLVFTGGNAWKSGSSRAKKLFASWRRKKVSRALPRADWESASLSPNFTAGKWRWLSSELNRATL